MALSARTQRKRQRNEVEVEDPFPSFSRPLPSKSSSPPSPSPSSSPAFPSPSPSSCLSSPSPTILSSSSHLENFLFSLEQFDSGKISQPSGASFVDGTSDSEDDNEASLHPESGDDDLDQFFTNELEIGDEEEPDAEQPQLAEPPNATESLSHVLMRNDPIYPGSHMKLADALLVLFIFFLTSHIPKIRFQGILDILHLFLPPNLLPNTVESFLGLFGSIEGKVVIHEYCESCCHLFRPDESKCPHCQILRYRGGLGEQQQKKPNCFFLELPMENDIREFFQDEEFLQGIKYRFQRKSEPGVLKDIQDGSAYRHLMTGFLRDPHNLCLGFNTDGVSPYKSSTYQMWPIFWQVHDLPPETRFLTKNTRLCGLWFGKTKPTMNRFLGPFHSEAKRFFDTGFKVLVHGKETVSRGVVLTGSMDSPAKADVQGFTHHNGKYGCSFCLNPGLNVSTESKKKSTVHVYEAIDCPNRTQEGTIAAAKEASRTGEYVLGVRYPSIFLLGYSIVWTFPIDYMHAVCLGVAKKLTSLWFDPKYSSYPWTLSEKITQIDTTLRCVKPPRDIKRLPRSLKERQHWKASEYRSWLLFFAPVLLESCLPRLYHQHLLLLVSALHILLSDHITERGLSQAEKNLKAFCQVFELIYGLRYATINLHLLEHLSDCVRRYGPLWTISCFPFENANGFLVRCLTGTHNSVLNMTNSALCLLHVRKTKEDARSKSGRELIKKFLGTESEPRRDTLPLKGGIAVGPFVSLKGCLTSSRAIVGGDLIESLAYRRNSRRNNFTIPTKKGLAVVESFVIRKESLYANLCYLRKSNSSSSDSFGLCPTIQKFTIDPNKELALAEDIVGGPLMTVSRGGNLYVVDLPFSKEVN